MNQRLPEDIAMEFNFPPNLVSDSELMDIFTLAAFTYYTI